MAAMRKMLLHLLFSTSIWSENECWFPLYFRRSLSQSKSMFGTMMLHHFASLVEKIGTQPKVGAIILNYNYQELIWISTSFDYLGKCKPCSEFQSTNISRQSKQKITFVENFLTFLLYRRESVSFAMRKKFRISFIDIAISRALNIYWRWC